MQVAAGELAPDAPELQALLASDPAAREHAEQWLATADALTHLGRSEAAERAEERAPKSADLALAREFLRSRGERPRARWRKPLWLTLAAAAAFLLWLLTRPTVDEEQEPLLLGQDGIELLAPEAGWRAFHWRPRLAPPALARYRLVLGSGQGELLRVEGLQQPVYRPSPEELTVLTAFDELHWRVMLVSGDGSESILAWGSAQSSRP